MPINLVLKDEESPTKKDLKVDAEYNSKAKDNKTEYINKQLELIWKKFLEKNPSISEKLDEVPENIGTVGSILLSNGMYDEATKWKEFRRSELSKMHIKDNYNDD